MKISDMTTVQATTALCKIAQPLANIAQDEKLVSFFRTLNREEMRHMPVMVALAQYASTLIPLVLDAHAADVLAIASAMTGKTTAEVQKQPIMTTLAELRDCVDSELIDFFTSYARTARKKPSA